MDAVARSEGGLRRKLAILADAAKYDASCASSGAPKRNARAGGLGSTNGNGICHAYAPDGRCISLLKILLTNFCIYDCLYCINRNSSDVERARFTVQEVVDLTLGFYRRNYIEGLFLSSGIVRGADETMEQMVEVARRLRRDHGFKGYIHLKTIPEASPALILEAGRLADRLSINVELPTATGLRALAPQKSGRVIRAAMATTRLHLDEALAERKAPRFAPAGQSTQMIVGADGADDRAVLRASAALYGGYQLKRVYYSAYSPTPAASGLLPATSPPLMREHRLYQADWLTRLYGFALEEVLEGAEGGMLALDIDPKLAWALRHRGFFPVDLNAADREALLRVPGLGVRIADRLLAARRWRRLRVEDLPRLGLRSARVMAFATVDGVPPRLGAIESGVLRARLAAPPQLDLFAAAGSAPVGGTAALG